MKKSRERIYVNSCWGGELQELWWMIVIGRLRLAFHFPERKIKAQVPSEPVTYRHSTRGFYYHALELCTLFSFINHRAQQA